MNTHGCFVFGLLLLHISIQVVCIPFESCQEAVSYVGNCTQIQNDGAIGAESVNNVLIRNGYLNYGAPGGCPYQNNTCPTGFSYYGWTKFMEYPTPCSAFGVLVSTQVFNVHLLGNGHLATYAWLPNGTEYYAESPEPVLLNFWTPIIVQFQYFTNNGTWRLIVVVQNQLFAGAISGRPRTYIPPAANLFFAGNGVNNVSSLYVQIDRSIPDGVVRDIPYMTGFLLDVPARQSNCLSKNGVLNSLTCYWVEPAPLNWTNAFKNCKSNGYSLGYPYGILGQFPSWNQNVWSSMVQKIASYGNGSVSGKKFWIGGGHRLQWLDINMTPTGITAVVPPNVTSNTSTSTSTTCLQVDTKPWPWQWSESSCSNLQPYICEMSYDCFLNNPCKNQGACQPINDGYNICKCWPGTSGQFCENGLIQVNCVNNCPCPNPLIPPPSTNGNCSQCLTEMKMIFDIISMLSLKLKVYLAEQKFSIEKIDGWTCDLTANYTILVQKIIGKALNTVDQMNCSLIWQWYDKILLYVRMVRSFLRTADAKSAQKVFAELNVNWTDVQSKIQMLSNLPCFVEFVSPTINDTKHAEIRNFLAHTKGDDDDDDHDDDDDDDGDNGRHWNQCDD